VENEESVGIDGITADLVRSLPKLLAKILIPLYNESIEQGSEGFEIINYSPDI